jgi:hypothetical protein
MLHEPACRAQYNYGVEVFMDGLLGTGFVGSKRWQAVQAKKQKGS